MITLLLYLAATVLTAFAWDLSSIMCFRFLTGAGIGGEYAAINSAIDELIPARRRGHTDLAINGTWWLGSAAGALLSLVFLIRCSSPSGSDGACVLSSVPYSAPPFSWSALCAGKSPVAHDA